MLSKYIMLKIIICLSFGTELGMEREKIKGIIILG